MKIFALETNRSKLEQSFCQPGECIVLSVHFHPFIFFVKLFFALLWTAIVIAAVVVALNFGAPLEISAGIAAVFWLLFIFIPLFRAYIDWHYDALVLTTEQLVYVQQSSIFKREIQEINFESIATVHDATQFGNLFSFGRLTVKLKEHIGHGVLDLKYIPHARDVATRIGNAMVAYDRAAEKA